MRMPALLLAVALSGCGGEPIRRPEKAPTVDETRKIMQDAMEKGLAEIDANPKLSAAEKASQKGMVRSTTEARLKALDEAEAQSSGS